jgi:hypothetical protein
MNCDPISVKHPSGDRHRLLKAKFEVDEVLNPLLIVNLGHMPSHGHIAGIALRRR